MYCTYCGKKIPDDGEFCPYCGRSNKTGMPRKDASPSNRLETELEKRRFDFGTFESNDNSINEINTWLSQHDIAIYSVSFMAHLNLMRTRTILSQCEIRYKYYKDAPYTYRADYFSSYHLISSNHSELDQQLDYWEANHPDCMVVYHTHIGHQYSGGNTMSLYFLYRKKSARMYKSID